MSELYSRVWCVCRSKCASSNKVVEIQEMLHCQQLMRHHLSPPQEIYIVYILQRDLQYPTHEMTVKRAGETSYFTNDL